MYQSVQFREDRLEIQHDLIRSHPLGLLVRVGDCGLAADPIPFIIDETAGELGTLRCHVARANPVWQELQAVAECLVVFQGPQIYITPSWYPTKRETGRVVPTWNYATVHAWGRPLVTEDQDWLRRQIDALTTQQEAQRSEPWAVDDAPAPYVAAQIRGIVGIEIPIARIEGKWKVSQNRADADRAGVAAGLRKEASSQSAMADIVLERIGKTPSRT